jgi:ribosome-binding protein aMBF1 (putative translation factor)
MLYYNQGRPITHNRNSGTGCAESTNTGEIYKPCFSVVVEQDNEKAGMASLLKTIREKEAVSQTQLAKMAKVPQSVIARIETNSSTTLPRLDLLTKLFSAMGYRIVIRAEKTSSAGKRT